MSRILLCRELGGGHGHVARLLPLAERLRSAGHGVVVAAPPAEQHSFAAAGFAVRDIPPFPTGGALQVREPGNFAELLMNFGGDDPAVLGTRNRQWRRLFEQEAAQTIVLESAPFGILAVQGGGFRSVSLGAGFFTPPDVTPLPELPGRQPAYRDRLLASEDLVLEAVNATLEDMGMPALPRLSRLFQQVDHLVLATFKELDHYGPREHSRYAGHWSRLPGGRRAEWPEHPGPRVFVYSRSIVLLDSLLDFLGRSGCAVLAYLPDADDAVLSRFQSRSMVLSREPFDLEEVRDSADVAIVNGGHATACDFLLAGVPLCVLPTKTEQVMVGSQVEALGAGRILLPATEEDLMQGLADFFSGIDVLASAAAAFAARYAHQDSAAILDQLVKDIAD